MKQNLSIIPQVLKTQPGLAIDLAKAFSKLEKARFFDYNFYGGKSHEMPLITFKITPLCNLRCVMCGQNGIHGTLKDRMKEEADKIIPLERYKELTDEVAGKTKVFYVWGGEPFLYPHFMDFAAYAAKKVLFTVNTNGTYLAQNAERIVKDQWTGIFISLDGFEDVNDTIRGKGTYKRVMEGIEAVNREKEKQGSNLPYMGIVSTISNMNYKYLDKLVEALGEKGLAWHIINLGTYMDESIGKDQTEWLKSKLGIEPQYWKGFTSGFNKDIDGNLFSQILGKVHSIANGYPVITVPVIKPEKIGRYYSDLRMLVEDHCAAPWFSVNINYNGDVHFCADYPDYIIGNIKEEKLWNIYNNERAIKFRKALKKSPHGLFPACNRCYQLMLCGRHLKGYQ
jgi:radical SAM protein with 4Fe4S-binding SPASM domain